MKVIKSFDSFRDLILNENAVAGLGDMSVFTQSTGSITKLAEASNVIARFLSKKIGKAYKVVMIPVELEDGGVAIDLYTDADESKVRVYGSSTRGQIVGALSYFKKYYDTNAEFSMSSDKFNIVSLLNEFALLAKDAKYLKEVETEMMNESALNEAKKKLSNAEVKQVQAALDKGGKSVREIALDFGVPQSQIYKVKRGNWVMETSEQPMETKNKMTLEDKVKYLDEVLQDIYDISSAIAAGQFNSLFISGRAGTGKTFKVLEAMKKAGLEDDEDFAYVSGSVSTSIMYKKLFQFNGKVLVFDDADAVFRDENGRNILKAALDTKKVRKISYLKMSKIIYDPKDFEDDPEGEMNALANGLVPAYFNFDGRIIFISNLTKDKADPDGAIRSRSILIDVNPDDATLMERIKTLLPYLEPINMNLKDKKEIFEFMKNSKTVSMRTFVKAAGFKAAGLKNWERMAKRYV